MTEPSLGGAPDAASGRAPPLEARDVWKSYRHGDGSELRVLEGVTLTLRRGEAVAVVGSSGAGKSTLLQILGALDRADAGEVRIGGVALAGLSDEALAGVRNGRIGFVFQFHHLLREFTALENAMMPLLIAGRPREEAAARGEAILRAVEMGHRLDHRPWQLSGGEQQRVAVARALANDPVLLLADEPSGNLDAETGEVLHDLLFRLRTERALSMVVVTHNRELAERADRILRMRRGRLLEEGAVDPRG